MTKVRDVVYASLRKIAVLASGEEADADAADEAVFALNGMMAGWKLRSVDIGHTELTLDHDFPLPQEFIEGTVFLLASRLSPDYLAPPTFNADAWFRGIQSAYSNVPLLKTEVGRAPSNIQINTLQC